MKYLRFVMSTRVKLLSQFASGFYVARAFAAAATAAISNNANIPLILDRMLAVLKIMHTNPSWGPLFVVPQGNIGALRFFVPRR